jgi:hypothetical protein
MATQLIVEPGKVYHWGTFCHYKPPYSLALDGIVEAKTQLRQTRNGFYAVIDHHLADDDSPATCMQVYRLILSGFFAPFIHEGEFRGNLFVNHPDEDVCLSVFLFKKFHQLSSYDSVRLTALVDAEDTLDRSAGMERIDGSLEGQLAWIFEPYHTARFQGRLPQLKAEAMSAIIIDVCSRIEQYLNGSGNSLSFTGQYETLGTAAGYTVVKETGPDARRAMVRDGVTAFISFCGRTNGNYVYSFWRHENSDAIPLPQLCGALNARENLSPRANNKWGCAGVRGGSPRLTGSRQSPEELIAFLRTFA